MFLKGIRTAAGAAAMLGLLCVAAQAQNKEIRLAQQFSMGYLQLNVMDHQKLIEKHAAALGLKDVKVSWFKFNGPTAVNEALISGNVDIGSGGVPGLLTLWARTKGTPQEVRGISALSSQPFLLNTRDPKIKTMKDFKDSDRIAVPAVKSSVQALTLQMEAAKLFGAKDFEKFDPLTVSMTPPDATLALLKGGAQITAAFSVPPFQYMQLEDKDVHTVLNSFDVMGGSHTFTAIWTSEKFRDANPILYKAFLAALKEATDYVEHNPKQAAEYLDRGFEIEAAARHRNQNRRRQAGALDDDAGKHHQICRLHVERRPHQGQGGVVEGLLLPGHLRPEGKLIS